MDDFYYVVTEEELPQAKCDIRAIGDFLVGYGLRLNLKKTCITEVHKGVKFLGAVVKGKKMFPGERVVRNFRETVKLVAAGEKDPDVIISYLGMMSHYDVGKVIAKAWI